MRNPGVFPFLWQRKCYIAHTVMRMSQNHPLCSRLCFLFKKKPLLLDDFSSILQQLSPYHTSAIWRMQGLPFYVYHLRFREIDDTSAPTSWNFIITSGHFPAGKPLFEEIDDTSLPLPGILSSLRAIFPPGNLFLKKLMILRLPLSGSLSSLRADLPPGNLFLKKLMILRLPLSGILSSLPAILSPGKRFSKKR